MSQWFFLSHGHDLHKVVIEHYDVEKSWYWVQDLCCQRRVHVNEEDLPILALTHPKFESAEQAERWLEVQSARPWRF
jgi:hypothetical protein